MLDAAGAGPINIEALAATDLRDHALEHGCLPGLRPRGSMVRLPLRQLAGLLVTLSVAGTVLAAWRPLDAAAAAVVPILWTLAPLLAVHGLQITLSAAAWSRLLRTERPTLPQRSLPMSLLFRLRVIREGIDSLLPIAQVGGEMIASAALVRSGLEPSLAAGSIMVDMVLELLAQLGFLTLGCFLLSGLSHGQFWSLWMSLGGTFAIMCGALLAAHRLGALRVVEAVVPRLARHVTTTPAFAIAGLHETVTRLIARPRTLCAAASLHFLHWLGGTAEVLIVLHAMGVAAGPRQALIMAAIGVAARSAGFMVPGSLVVQETGFMLGAALAGLPPQSALVFSLIRRLRELIVGGAGIALWRGGSLIAATV